ncbi:hypothetical protein O181_069431 [Austropuccinia psidii MF-1]|uniref:Integrase zinc-binding domain-containing protein n=1 Tax=Austropuccinia psidii MF-1 TaxID=1389203 RepID=A0A9Q3F3I0_9BASI|nr:hypothetical protein [Austropuccinia psidii MF-1]
MCVKTVFDRSLVNPVLKEWHDSPFSGHLSEDRTREKVKTCIWWSMWQGDVGQYLKTCDRCQQSKKYTGKRLGNMIKIQGPSRPWEISHMDWVTGLPPGGDKSNKSCLEIVERFIKTPIFLPFQKDDKAMDTSLLIWNRVVSWTGIFTNIMSDRDHEFTSELCTNLHQLFGTKLSFSTAYSAKCDELAYKTSIHASTNHNPPFLEKGWSPRLPQDSLRKDFVELHPTAASFKDFPDKARKYAVRCIQDSFAYVKDKWEKLHATPNLKMEDLILVSTNNFSKIKECNKLKDSFAGPFVIKALHGENDVEVELSEELMNKHPTFPVSLIKPYKSGDSEKFPLRNQFHSKYLLLNHLVIRKSPRFSKKEN